MESKLSREETVRLFFSKWVMEKDTDTPEEQEEILVAPLWYMELWYEYMELQVYNEVDTRNKREYYARILRLLEAVILSEIPTLGSRIFSRVPTDNDFGTIRLGATFVGLGIKIEADTLEEQEKMLQILKERNRLLLLQEEHRTKRLWLALAAGSTLIALLIIVFAPEGRETLSYWIGATLLIFAAGAAGYKRVWGKAPGVGVGADQGEGKAE